MTGEGNVPTGNGSAAELPTPHRAKMVTLTVHEAFSAAELFELVTKNIAHFVVYPAKRAQPTAFLV